METISSPVFLSELPGRLGAAQVPRARSRAGRGAARRGEGRSGGFDLGPELESNRFSETRPLGGRFKEIRSVSGKSSRFQPG